MGDAARLRSAMVRPDRDRLADDVEVDESYVGGEEAGVSGRQTQTKSIVAIAVEMKRPRGFGPARLRHVADCSAASLMPFVREAMELGSTVCTDGWKAYDGLNDAGYTRYRQVLSSSPDPAHVSMPGVHRVASLLKRWLLGTHQGSVDPRHLQAYLDEFTFRFLPPQQPPARAAVLSAARAGRHSLAPHGSGAHPGRLLRPTTCSGGTANDIPP